MRWRTGGLAHRQWPRRVIGRRQLAAGVEALRGRIGQTGAAGSSRPGYR